MSEVSPTRYFIRIDPDLEALVFEGLVRIELSVPNATDRIRLDAVDLTVQECSVSLDSQTIAARCRSDEESVSVELERAVSGDLTLTLAYRGSINDLMAGFYRSRYRLDGREKFLAVTQFEERDARRAFPCIDHPAAKAVFEIEMLTPSDHIAVSNTPVTSREEQGDGRVLFRFEPTPPMSTYLVFFGVGPFDVEVDESFRVPVRVAVSPGKGPFARKSLEFARKSLQFLEELTGVPYPLGKLDSIGVTDFAYGAMENFGAITYRENYLLSYPESTTRKETERMMGIAAHEIAHMWFGDLVSPADWQYIWLNEAFATYFGNFVTDHWFPEWRTMDQFVIGATASALARDGLPQSVPIELAGDEQVEVDASTAPIIYSKGAGILRMIRGYYGDEGFRRGAGEFLKKYSFDCADTDQFLAVFGAGLDRAADLGGVQADHGRSGPGSAGGVQDGGSSVGASDETTISSAQLLERWIRKPGVPLLRVSRTETGIRVQRDRFQYIEGDTGAEAGRGAGAASAEGAAQVADSGGAPWMVPVTGVTKVPEEEIRLILREDSRDVDLSEPRSWVKLNRDQTGYYRVYYEDPEDWNALGRAAMDGALSPLDRYGLVADMSAFVTSGQVRLDRYLAYLSSYFQGESEYVVLSEIAGALIGYYELLGGDDRIAECGRSILGPLSEEVLQEPSDDEPYRNVLLRDTVLWSLHLFGWESVSRRMQARFEAVRSGESIHPDLFPMSVRIGLASDPEAVEWVKEQLRSDETSEGRAVQLIGALSAVRDRARMGDVLDYVLSSVPVRNRLHFLRPVGSNPAARDLLWSWFVDNFADLAEIHPYHLGGMVTSVVPFGGLGKEEEVRSFLTEYRRGKPRISGGVIDVALNRLEINRRFQQREGRR